MPLLHKPIFVTQYLWKTHSHSIYFCLVMHNYKLKFNFSYISYSSHTTLKHNCLCKMYLFLKISLVGNVPHFPLGRGAPLGATPRVGMLKRLKTIHELTIVGKTLPVSAGDVLLTGDDFNSFSIHCSSRYRW